MNLRKTAPIALAALVLSCGLCLLLYHFDNKYTAPGAQPIGGILYQSEQELLETPVHYLIREWEFCPGVLLTPENADAWVGYRTYADVGGTNTMRRGSGTYRLRLMLPETPQSYALSLPAVFSACRLYVDGEQLLSLGVPEEASYREGISEGVAVFRAAGSTELLLSVRDQSGVYSGLTYPPAFGPTQAVLHARDLRFLIHGAGVLLAVFGMILSIGFGWHGNRRRGFLFLLCCLCFAFIAGYPLSGALFVTAYQPWYTLEAAGLYALLLLAVLLCCDLYKLPGKTALLFSAPCALGLVVGILRTAGAAYWGSGMGAAFSALSLVLKLYATLCLLGLTIWALGKEQKFSRIVLCGVLALSVCLAFDRLLPLHEPIYGGWFEEIGGAALVASLAAALWLDAMEAYRFRLTYDQQLQQLAGRLELQKEHYRQLSQQVALARETSHDLRQHIRSLRGMAEQGKTDRMLDYLDAYEPHLLERELTVYSDHLVADAVLSHYAAAAKKIGADCSLRFAVPPDLAFADDELCVLLGNLLENAVEAMARQEAAPRRLRLQGDICDARLRLVVENTFDGVINRRDLQYLSTKHPGVGLGLHSVRSIAEKYGGLADFSAENAIFRASVMIPLTK